MKRLMQWAEILLEHSLLGFGRSVKVFRNTVSQHDLRRKQEYVENLKPIDDYTKGYNQAVLDAIILVQEGFSSEKVDFRKIRTCSEEERRGASLLLDCIIDEYAILLRSKLPLGDDA